MVKKTSYPTANNHDQAPIPALGSRGWISGSGVPTAEGTPAQNGFHYLNTDNGDVYLKAAGNWGGPIYNFTGTTWYQGSGVPAAGLGVTVDFYLDTDNGDVYSKASGSWVLVDNLQGPVDWVMEWANNAFNNAVSVDAGGDGSTTFSALHWAESAQDWAEEAEDVAVTTPAGGDGITTFSAKHHAIKAAADVVLTGLDVTAADNARIAAEAAQTAAETAVNQVIWNDVVYISTTLNITDDSYRGKLIVVSTGSGNVDVNLPEISAVTMPYVIGVTKGTSDGNIVTVNASAADTNASGIDTIGGDASKTIASKDAGITLVADTDPAPDEWTPIKFGADSGNISVQEFVDVTHYVSGTTTQLTLSQDPGSENNIQVFFDGACQHHSEYTVTGTTLDFGVAIPLGTNKVEVIWTSTVSIGTPGDGSVTTPKLQNGNVTDEKLAADARVGRLIDSQVFTSSGDWTKPAGCTNVIVEVVGPGGGGGDGYGAASGDYGGAGGGGAGGYSYAHITAGLGITETITVGTGGAGATGNGATGSAGSEASSFGAHITCNPGNGGVGANSSGGYVFGAGGSGGTASGGDINVNGQLGASGLKGGDGASSKLGAGGFGGKLFTGMAGSNPGDSGNGYGAGGGGGAGRNGSSNGGAGAPGIVIVRSYY